MTTPRRHFPAALFLSLRCGAALAVMLATSLAVPLKAAERPGLYMTETAAPDGCHDALRRQVLDARSALRSELIALQRYTIITAEDLRHAAVLVPAGSDALDPATLCRRRDAACRRFAAERNVTLLLIVELAEGSDRLTATLASIDEKGRGEEADTQASADLHLPASSAAARSVAIDLHRQRASWCAAHASASSCATEATRDSGSSEASGSSATTAPLSPRVLRWTWLGVGLSVASITAAAIVSAQAVSLEDEFQEVRKASRSKAQSGSLLMGYKREADRHALAASVLWGVAGAALAGTVAIFCVEYFLTPDEPGQARRVVIAPALLPDGAAVSAQVRF